MRDGRSWKMSTRTLLLLLLLLLREVEVTGCHAKRGIET